MGVLQGLPLPVTHWSLSMGSTQNCGLRLSVVASQLATQGLDSWLCSGDTSMRCLVVPPYSCCNKATHAVCHCPRIMRAA